MCTSVATANRYLGFLIHTVKSEPFDPILDPFRILIFHKYYPITKHYFKQQKKMKNCEEKEAVVHDVRVYYCTS